MSKPICILISGISQSGKTTWIDENITNECFDGCIHRTQHSKVLKKDRKFRGKFFVCSFDRLSNIYSNSWWMQAPTTNLVWESKKSLKLIFNELTNQKFNVVIDGPNLKRSSRRLFIQKAKESGYDVIGVEMITPLKVVIDRYCTHNNLDENSERAQNIKLVWDNREPLSESEGYDEIIKVDSSQENN